MQSDALSRAFEFLSRETHAAPSRRAVDKRGVFFIPGRKNFLGEFPSGFVVRGMAEVYGVCETKRACYARLRAAAYTMPVRPPDSVPPSRPCRYWFRAPVYRARRFAFPSVLVSILFCELAPHCHFPAFQSFRRPPSPFARKIVFSLSRYSTPCTLFLSLYPSFFPDGPRGISVPE